ncbi:MAG: MBL fold metallo-hydrolase [Oscillospiraceae bacterium]|nr:MBL fold metallo-hydrolase [Oscillospiraceae bacterium]
MARIYPICSSSRGNATFIGTRGHGVLIDAGCSFRALKNALDLIDTRIENIEAIFITHEHIDHIKGLEQIVKQTKIPVFAPPLSVEAMKADGKLPQDAQLFDTYDGYKSASFEVSCFKTSHDTADSVGYKIRYHNEIFAVCTDTGIVTEETESALKGVTTVLIESNYDEDMLRKNPNYHASLKRRIMSDVGHLSNVDCAEFCETLVRGGTRHLILGHLSQENNTPATAKNCTKRFLEQRGLVEERDFTLAAAPVMTSGEFVAV